MAQEGISRVCWLGTAQRALQPQALLSCVQSVNLYSNKPQLQLNSDINTVNMYAQFQASYQRVEASLQKLTDSIAAYKPSVSAADELVAADEGVKQNLDECK